jgi:hypothetical protein
MTEFTRMRELQEPGTLSSAQYKHRTIAVGGIPGAWNYYTHSIQTGVGDKTMYDIPTKDFYRRSRNGEIFNNPLDQTYVLTEWSAPAAVSLLWKKLDGSGFEYGGQFCAKQIANNFSFLEPLDLGADEEWLINSAVSKAHANISSANAVVLMMAGEGKATVQSIADILFRLLRLIRAVKTLDWKYLRKEISFKELQERYMELRYAIRPLVYDAAAITNAYNAKLEACKRQTFRGFAETSEIETDTVSVDGAQHGLTVERTVATSVSVRAGVLTDVYGSQMKNWGTDQFLETMLELTPFSFIFNWFFNISDWLCSWSPNLGIKNLASWYVLEHKTVSGMRLVDSHVNNAYYGYYNLGPLSGVKTMTHLSRVPNPTLSALPQVAVNLDVLKIFDLAIIGKKLLANYRK